MASGDKLKHRGSLTKQIINGLSGVIENDPAVRIGEIVVDFRHASQGGKVVSMLLVAALESVTFDIGFHDGVDVDWSPCNVATVRPMECREQVKILFLRA